MESKLRHFFICNNCRAYCQDNPQCMDEMDHGLYPRKQVIDCLGEWCDEPCDLRQEPGNLKTEQLVTLVKYLSTELNKLMINEPIAR